MFLRPLNWYKNFFDQVSCGLILKLIKDILRVLQKLVSYLDGTTISTSFVFPASRVLSVILALNPNKAESIPCSCKCSYSTSCYSSLNKNVWIAIVTETCLHQSSLKFDLTTRVVLSMRFIIHINPVYYFEFWWLVLSRKFMIFW